MNSPAGAFLPYGRHEIDDEDIAAVTAVLRSDFLTTGPKVEELEAALAMRTNARRAVVCASGTAGLHLACLALELGSDDHVVVPSQTFLATANAVRYVGAEVLFADVDPETGVMRPADLEAALARAGGLRVKAAIPVHLAGRAADMAGLADVARRYGLQLVEDAAHAIGTRYGTATNDAGPVGDCRFSDMAVFSFHPVKTVAMGEGGAITTNSPGLYRRLKRLRSHGMVREPDDFVTHDLAFDAAGSPNPWYYEMTEPGFHYRATDIQCALGLSQLSKLGDRARRRGELWRRYRDALITLAPLVRPPADPIDCEPAWHLFAARIEFAAAGIDRATVMRRLRDQGIGSQVHYIPVHLQPYYRRRYGDLSLPGAATYYERTLSLPLFPAMTDSDVVRVAEALAREIAKA